MRQEHLQRTVFGQYFRAHVLNLFDQTLLQEIPMERTRMWLDIQTRFINDTGLKRAKVFSFRPFEHPTNVKSRGCFIATNLNNL